MGRKYKYSMGGDVVAGSLRAVGYELHRPGTSLVETANPLSRCEVVLLQSAWNVIPKGDFRRLISRYPRSMQLRAIIRRQVAQVNLRRAQRVVCLTYAVADLLQREVGVNAVVSPVTIPVNVAELEIPNALESTPYVLVPGTVTWFKRPVDALSVVADGVIPGVRRIVYCGRDDGSGCWEHVRRRAMDLNIDVERRVVPREELYALYRKAAATLLPSELESLGFGLSEALSQGGRVLARAIPSHVETSERLGINAEWAFGPAPQAWTGRDGVLTESEALSEWMYAGKALRLQPA